MRSKVRAYSHQGHGPRADQQAGYISATSASAPSLAKRSRSIHISDFRQRALTCETQPVHTLGSRFAFCGGEKLRLLSPKAAVPLGLRNPLFVARSGHSSLSRGPLQFLAKVAIGIMPLVAVADLGNARRPS